MRTIFPDHAEDQLKVEYFGSAKGFFVEVGANDPCRGSQTWAFEQAGWTGILIEPQPELAEALRTGRKARVFAVACSSPANAGKNLRLYVAGPHSSLDRRLAVTGVTPESTIEVPTRTLDDILVEAGARPQFEFLSIDVEGQEIEVLKGFDVARWQPRLIIMEDHVTSLAKHRTLVRSGYRLFRRTGLNGWYVPSAHAPALGVLGRWSLARKYYVSLPFRMLRDWKRRLRDRIRQKSDPKIGDRGFA